MKQVNKKGDVEFFWCNFLMKGFFKSQKGGNNYKMVECFYFWF